MTQEDLKLQGETIRDMRRARGLTVKEFAHKIEVPIAIIAKIEVHGMIIDDELMQRIDKILQG